MYFMNIFYLSNDCVLSSRYLTDKHCIKMPLESAIMLSSVHRILDGVEGAIKTTKGKNKKHWMLPDERESILYKVSHINHPSTIWTRTNVENYMWHYKYFIEMLNEYTYRYGKIHACSKLIPYLKNPPNNILVGKFTEPTPAMPKEYIVDGDSIASYRNYYNGAKQHLAKWSGKLNNRGVPFWFKPQIV